MPCFFLSGIFKIKCSTGSLNFLGVDQVHLLLVALLQHLEIIFFLLDLRFTIFCHLVLLSSHPVKKCRGGESAVVDFLASVDTGYARQLPAGHTRFGECLCC